MSALDPDTIVTPSAASAFAALGDVTRLALLSRLLDGCPRSIVQLTAGLGLTRQGVSKHLKVLRESGMVERERVGRESRYVFRPAGLDELRTCLDRASAQWDDAAVRLKTFVEEREG